MKKNVHLNIKKKKGCSITIDIKLLILLVVPFVKKIKILQFKDYSRDTETSYTK